MACNYMTVIVAKALLAPAITKVHWKCLKKQNAPLMKGRLTRLLWSLTHIIDHTAERSTVQ